MIQMRRRLYLAMSPGHVQAMSRECPGSVQGVYIDTPVGRSLLTCGLCIDCLDVIRRRAVKNWDSQHLTVLFLLSSLLKAARIIDSGQAEAWLREKSGAASLLTADLRVIQVY
ncbi:hypothetical protein NUW58_g8200 [Xylaria curta]|uniref:Uncharacterized protein n=1 Tax=Xylaria curta TaxID=42375 RepID=A0ACC1N9M7_9PEZI|nr:hypothetical protein NUW58_g8200 [Xylaria curta]